VKVSFISFSLGPKTAKKAQKKQFEISISSVWQIDMLDGFKKVYYVRPSFSQHYEGQDNK
jgi:hypothetical protein